VSGICFAGCAFNLPVKLIMQLHGKVFGSVYSFQGMTIDNVVLSDIALVGDSQKLTLF